MHYKVIAIYLNSNIFGGGHLTRISLIEKYLNKNFHKIIKLSISSLDELSEIIDFYIRGGIFLLDISHPKIVNKFSKDYAKIVFKNSSPLIIDGVDKRSNISQFFGKNKCKVLIPYVFNSKRIKINQKNIIGVGESFFIFDKKLNLFKTKSLKISNLSAKKNVLITFGHSDPCKLTLKIIKILKELELDKKYYNFLIATGNYLDKKYIQELEKIDLYENMKLIGSNFYKYLEKINCAISASGLTKYELTLFDIPQLLIHIDIDQYKSNIEFEKESEIKSLMQEHITNKYIYDFLLNHEEFKPNNLFVKRLQKSFLEESGLKLIDDNIREIILKN